MYHHDSKYTGVGEGTRSPVAVMRSHAQNCLIMILYTKANITPYVDYTGIKFFKMHRKKERKEKRKEMKFTRVLQ